MCGDETFNGSESVRQSRRIFLTPSQEHAHALWGRDSERTDTEGPAPLRRTDRWTASGRGPSEPVRFTRSTLPRESSTGLGSGGDLLDRTQGRGLAGRSRGTEPDGRDHPVGSGPQGRELDVAVLRVTKGREPTPPLKKKSLSSTMKGFEGRLRSSGESSTPPRPPSTPVSVIRSGSVGACPLDSPLDRTKIYTSSAPLTVTTQSLLYEFTTKG